MVDARGVEIPYLDRDGNELKRFGTLQPGKGQTILPEGAV